MTDDNEMSNAAVGFAIGLLIFGGLGGLGAWAYVKRTHDNVRRGWNLRPVLVARTDLAAGAMIRVDDLAEGSVPEQIVTSSVLQQSDSRAVIGLSTSVPVKAGEPLRWSFFVNPNAMKLSDPATAPSLVAAAHACSQVADPAMRLSTVAELRARVEGARQ